MKDFIYLDDSQERWTEILANHLEEARQRALSLIAAGTVTETGCVVTGTIYCVLNDVAPSFEEVIRHRCHNGHCINPEHLDIGSRADNKRDDWDFLANGVDFDYL